MSFDDKHPPVSMEVWRDNYKAENENSLQDTWERQARACASIERDEIKESCYNDFLWLLSGFKGIAGGRITANLGVPGREATTNFNCFVFCPSDVNYKDVDSIDGIYDMLKAQAKTLKSEGGYGMNFSWIRPAGSYVEGIAGRTPGVLKFMELWDKSSEIITMGSEKIIGERKPGEKKKMRKGAQMGILNCTHPEVEDFIDAKLTEGRLSKFNLSVGITGGFMDAVKRDADWHLRFPDTSCAEYKEKWSGLLEEWEAAGLPTVVYKTIKARDLWEKIMRSTYERNDPGVLYFDLANKLNPLTYAENIQTTNPCFHGDERFLTDSGYVKFSSSAFGDNEKEYVLTDNRVFYENDGGVEEPSKWKFNLTQTGTTKRLTEKAFVTKEFSDLLLLEFANGQTIKCTPDHHIATTAGMIEAQYLTSEHNILVSSPTPPITSIHNKVPTTNNEICAFIMGLVAGDGCIYKNHIHVDVWGDDSERMSNLITSFIDKLFEDQKGMINKDLLSENWKNRPLSKYCVSKFDNKTRITSTWLKYYLQNEYSFTKKTKQKVPEFIFEHARKPEGHFYLAGLYYADGTIGGDKQKGVSVRLSQSNKLFLKDVQLLLQANGIPSKTYKSKSQYELITVCGGWKTFAKLISLNHPDKDKKLQALAEDIKENYTKQNYTNVASISQIEGGTVFCIKENDTRSIIVNGITVRRCGEIKMSTGVCLLFSLNLVAYVKKHEDKFVFDFDMFKKATSIAMRFADNINDLSTTPLYEYDVSLKQKRRVGLGVLGLGSLHYILGIRFGSDESVKLIEQIFKTKAETEILESAKLGKEKGSFELFDRDKYFNTYWWKTLPISDDIKKQVEEIGEMRNSHRSANAPTGNMSIYAGCVSGGIEPVFEKEYYRWVIVTEGDRADLRKNGFEFPDIFKGEWFETKDMKESKAGTDSVLLGSFNGIEYQVDKNRGLTKKVLVRDWGWDFVNKHLAKETLKQYENSGVFATTQDLSVDEHINTLKIITKYVDMNSSKTVNIPNDYSYDDFKNLYQSAYNSNIKGITSYRAGTMTAVLEAVNKNDNKSTNDNNKTVNLSEKNERTAMQRPTVLRSETHKIKIDFGGVPKNAYVTISFFPNSNKPYEVFVQAPSGLDEKDMQILELTTRNASMNLRHKIPLRYICEQMEKVGGQYIFSIPIRVAKILRQYLNEQDDDCVLNDEQPITMTDSHVEKSQTGNITAKCPSCNEKSYVLSGGCGLCNNCFYSGCN